MIHKYTTNILAGVEVPDMSYNGYNLYGIVDTSGSDIIGCRTITKQHPHPHPPKTQVLIGYK